MLVQFRCSLQCKKKRRKPNTNELSDWVDAVIWRFIKKLIKNKYNSLKMNNELIHLYILSAIQRV